MVKNKGALEWNVEAGCQFFHLTNKLLILTHCQLLFLMSIWVTVSINRSHHLLLVSISSSSTGLFMSLNSWALWLIWAAVRATFPRMWVNRMCCCLCRTLQNTKETCSFLSLQMRKSLWFPGRFQPKWASLSWWRKQLFGPGSLKLWNWNKVITKHQQQQLFLEGVYRKFHLKLFRTKPSVVKMLFLPSWCFYGEFIRNSSDFKAINEMSFIRISAQLHLFMFSSLI